MITAPLSHVKSRYANTGVNHNPVTQSVEPHLRDCRFCSCAPKAMNRSEEMVALYLYPIYRYHWLETSGYSAFLQTTILREMAAHAKFKPGSLPD